ncbi:ionotropic receptor 75a-like [Anabrus simplex]|uniref:ionotropic receptor 75a-like n=1 Tax=Anabrus simplex TaxID=316456 RepID=UPI0035A3A4D4
MTSQQLLRFVPTTMGKQGLQQQSEPVSVNCAELEDDWSHHSDLRYKHLNTWNKIFYVLVRQLSVKYNFRMREQMANTWGYMKDGNFDGMVGMLQRGEADMGSAGIVIKKYRLFAIDVTAEVTTFRPNFLFRQPRLSAVANIYLLPFSRGVWATYLSTLVLLTAVVVGIDKRMKKYMPSNGDHPPKWSDVVFRAMGILCDEGYPATPESLSSRIVLLFMLILSVFHVTSYGACVVSLLQTPSTGYDTLVELLDSPIKMAMQDIPYNETDSPIVHRIFKERLYTVPHKQAFMPLNEGVERVRHGMFAFHVDISAYKYIKDTYFEDEKCGLKRVPLFQTQMLSVPIAKNSPYKDLITRGLRWQRETGLINRELKRWTTSKPECANRDASFVSVGLQEFSPVLMVLFVGIGISITLFIVENLVFNLQKCHSKPKDLVITLRT